MMRRFWRRLLATLVFLLLAGALTIVWRTDPNPLSQREITNFTEALNEAAAIGVPHGFLMDDSRRSKNLELLAAVEAGTPLDADQSLAYRKLFQATLQDSQNFLSVFDAELSILQDHAMHIANNAQTRGIEDHHDHHDLSAQKNFSQLLHSLERLENSTTSLDRIRFASAAQKDLVDLISHVGVAPHTISVPYSAPEEPWPDRHLGTKFEAMLFQYKLAQFALVNSTEYWTAIDAALQSYDALILAVQDKVMQHTSSWERRISGRFMSVQTLAPPVDLSRPLRRKTN